MHTYLVTYYRPSPLKRMSAPVCGAVMAALLLATGCAQRTADEAPLQSEGPLTRDDGDPIRDQVEAHWHIPVEAISECPTPFELRVSLAPDGKVTQVEMPVDETTSDACRASMESARRAVLIASPLKIPGDGHISALRLRFDPSLYK
jgi:hypothetical protein